MILGILETILGLILIDTSVKSLKKSVIRKWREGYVISLITGFIALIHGLASFTVIIPNGLNTALLFIISFFMTIALFRISRMKGLYS